MNSHGTFIITSLYFAMITILVGFAARTGTLLEAEKYYVTPLEALDEIHQLTAQMPGLKYAEIVKVTLTAYSPTRRECDDDPHVTASMTRVRSGIIAVSRDLFRQGWNFGKKVYVKGHGVFEIADLMNKRYTRRVDIFIPNTQEARNFGTQKSTIVLLDG